MTITVKARYKYTAMTMNLNLNGWLKKWEQIASLYTSKVTVQAFVKRYSRNLFTVTYEDHSSNFLDNHRLPDLPISRNFYSAERYLSTRNTVEIKHRGDDYMIIITFLNGGQIMGMKRY